MARKILVIDTIATNRIVLKAKFAAAYHSVLQASTGQDAIRIAIEERPDLILLNEDLSGADGIDLCRLLKANPAASDIPVLMTGSSRDPARRLAALQAGAEDLLWKPMDDLVLMARLRNLFRVQETHEQLGLRDQALLDLGFSEPEGAFAGAGTIGIIAATAEHGLAIKHALAQHMNDRLLVLDREKAMTDRSEGPLPEVYLIAASHDRPGDGLRFMSELRAKPASRHAGMCLLTHDEGRDTSALAYDLGASEVVSGDMAPVEIAARLTRQVRRKRAADRLRDKVAAGLRMALHDPLTGLNNRRFALPHLARIASRCREQGTSCAVLLIDIDRFKAVNDTWGHAAGDAVLIEVAARLRDNLRPGDMLARIGGEEFLAVLQGRNRATAQVIAERLRMAVADHPVRLAGPIDIPITLSIGLAVYGGIADTDLPPVDDLIAGADRALMRAKGEGRNRVTNLRAAA